ncbi:hypothetical protein BKA70DRAFT_1270958 [Coprinopsis sp. MPI-PUGE-AT-0042]|nr:hypothetical protein BKA70DRAFT_1270958 [Coprinopsis sp. MPI-PUGE-AT-0042]
MAVTSNKSSILFVLFLCFLGSVSALATRETNANRLARGLTPLQPQGMERANRRATGTGSARRSMVSPLPPTTASGRLQVRYVSSGSNAGFVRNWEGGAPISGVSFLGGDEELQVTVAYSPSSPRQCNIHATNAKFPAPYLVGASGGPGKLEGGRTLGFTNVPETQPGSLPTQVGTENKFVESAIWSFDPFTKQLKAFWINDDSTTTEAVLAYAVRENSLFFVGNTQAWMDEHPNYFISAVNLYLV